MKDFTDIIYSSTEASAIGDISSQKIWRSSLCSVPPQITEKELTKRQKQCLEMKVIENMSQAEIAEALGISQPTVCRHIELAKKIVNNRLSYCAEAVGRANKFWLNSLN